MTDDNATLAAAAMRERAADTFYVDCEFDGHNGPLLSIAMVRGDGIGIHVTTDAEPTDPWVIANVLPIMDSHRATLAYRVKLDMVGEVLRGFIGDCQAPTIVADSPVDIARFCRAISTRADGGWASAGYPRMSFRVENVDCYPTNLEGAVRHNAWWDAMALRAVVPLPGDPLPAALRLPEVAKLIEAANSLCFHAQTTGGTAGPDDALMAAIGQYIAALAVLFKAEKT